MEQQDFVALVHRFGAGLDTLERHRAFVERAHDHRDRFSPVVVDRVVAEHGAICATLVTELGAVVSLVEDTLRELAERRSLALERVADHHLRLEERALRRAIGECVDDDPDVDGASADAEQVVADLDARAVPLAHVLDRWAGLRGTEDPFVPGDWTVGEEDVADEVPEAPPRAVLLMNEGTSEESVFPLGEHTSVGRGRNNDIQVRQDPKVSRSHCRVCRAGRWFVLEDAASANGTLVNGELVSERRLYGGEEIIVGETFLRFRLTGFPSEESVIAGTGGESGGPSPRGDR